MGIFICRGQISGPFGKTVHFYEKVHICPSKGQVKVTKISPPPPEATFWQFSMVVGRYKAFLTAPYWTVFICRGNFSGPFSEPQRGVCWVIFNVGGRFQFILVMPYKIFSLKSTKNLSPQRVNLVDFRHF